MCTFDPSVTTEHCLPIIGYVRSPLSQKFGIPRQPNLVDIPCQLHFVAPYDDPQAFDGLDSFSHLWVIWQFHQNREPQGQRAGAFRPQVRPPRLGGNARIGVFASRSMYRPSQLGLSLVRLDKIAVSDGKVTLHIIGGDMVDGTPIVDIKPYLAYSDSLPTATSGYANQPPVVKAVQMTATAQQQAEHLTYAGQLTADDIGLMTALIAQDPRPAYRQAEVNTPFIMRYRQVDVSFTMNDSQTLVIFTLQAV